MTRNRASFIPPGMARTGKPRSLRQKIADWPPLTEGVAALLAAWFRLVRATSRVDDDGWDEIEAVIREHGAVLIVFWHERTFGAPFYLRTDRVPGCSINADTRAGRAGAAVLRHFGLATVPIRKGRAGTMSALREVLSGLANGVSAGVATDGPSGPERQAKEFAIQWARSSGKPVVMTSFAARRFLRWPTWDRMIFPLPFNRIAVRWRVWDVQIPRRIDVAQTEALAAQLSRAIDAVTAESDRAVARV